LKAALTKDQLEELEQQKELDQLYAAVLQKDEKSYKQDSKRCGLIAQKLGMMNVWDGWGVKQDVTVIRIDNHVIHHNEAPCPRTGLLTMKVGAGTRKPKKTPDWLARMCDRAECEYKQRLHDFAVTPDAVIPVGTRLLARHFNPGQCIDVQGITRGRGFQGPMKRWGFKGQPASHGISKTHRSHGSTGATGVGKVWKGKKMAGNMGNRVKIVYNSKIYKIDTSRNLIFLLGSIPGANGSWVLLRDAAKLKFKSEEDAPCFPTYTADPDVDEPAELVMPREGSDPFAYGLE